MRLWKRLLGTALCLCAAVCLMSVSASAAEHSHPICGAAHTDIGDHTETCEKVTWTAWNGTSEISYADGTNTAYVYLGDNATRSRALKVSNGQTLNLCLNGKTLSRTYTVIEVTGGATLNICDCQGGGGITISSGCVIEVDTRDDVNGNAVFGTATLNLYGGKLSTDDTDDSGTVKLYNNDGNEPRTVAVFNMYGGEVHNKDSGESAVYASYANIGTGYYNINMYGGSVTCEKGNGFKLNNNENITMQITGGTITGGRYGVGLSSQNTLTLAGNPKFIDTAFYSGTANISIPGDVTLTVKDDFAPAEETKVSVRKSVDSFGSVVFAAPAESKSLSSKAQHFVSAKEGYFVECADGVNLQLTACAITKQPAVNDYTVTANGGAKAAYQWYSVTKGDVPVTSKNATTKDFSSSGDVGEWSCVRRAENGDLVPLGAFTLHMNAGDKLTLTEARRVEGFSIAVSGGTSDDLGTPSRESDIFYIAPADGEYTLTVTAMPQGEYLMASFTATVTADVPDKKLPDQTTAKLNTTGLPSGSYICQVTWENKTTLNSEVVRYATAPSHVHSWSSEWTSDTTHHWHNCENANCPVTENSAKDGYGSHIGGTATCQAKAVCETCGQAYGELKEHPWADATCTEPKTCPVCQTVEGTALGHDFENGTWQSDGDHHWKKCSRCDVTDEANKAPHSGGTANCTQQAVCTICGTAYGALDANNHIGVLGVWQSNEDKHWKEYSCCNVHADVGSHQWDEGRETKSPTCTEDGVKTFTCSQCNNTKTEPISALGHDFENGTWQSDGDHHWKKCSRCDVTDTKTAHRWNEGRETKSPTCTTAGEKTYICTDCGRTKTEQIDALGHDWGEWVVTKPATTSAAGEETRTCKRDASHTETHDIPKLTPAPSGGGSSSAPAITVPVSGSGDTVHVSASVSGSTAEVKEVKKTELDKIGTDSAVVIDLSGLNKGVTGVTLSTDTIASICKTEATGVTVKLPSAELRVDRQTLAAVTEQAAGSKIRLVVEPDGTARSTMTAAQRSALDGMRNAAVLEAYFVSDGTRIHDFKGGSVELSIPYRAEGAIRAWFLKEDGTREPVSARYDKENAQLILHHFSHYVIEELDSSAAYTVCAKDNSCPLGAFGDLTAAAWYHDGVHYCLENGLMRGVSGGKFLPDGSTTRAQLVTILWRLEGSPETTGAVRFNDTAGGAWYTEAVRWAAGRGVVKGYDNGRFGPNDAVTREQMAAILYRYAQHKGYDVSAGNDTNILSFDDAFAVSEYAIPAMQWACGSGMVRGIAQKGGMALAPRDTTTRAQTATLLTRFQSAFAKEP